MLLGLLLAFTLLPACAPSTRVHYELATNNEIRQERPAHSGALLLKSVNDNDVEQVKQLLASGADPNARDSGSYTPLMNATIKGNTEMVKALLNSGAKIDETNNLNETALLFAIEAGRTELVELLVDKGADMRIKGPPPVGATVLHVAARRNTDREILNILLTKAIDLNIRDDYGNTPLMVAAANNVAVVRLLIDKGADVNAANNKGGTPLMSAVGSPEIIKILLQHGADVNARDKDGWTPLEIALLHGCPEIIEMLEKAGAVEP